MTGYTSGILTVPFASYLRSSIKYLTTKRLNVGSITFHLAKAEFAEEGTFFVNRAAGIHM